MNKYIAASGICSRREADQLISAGLVYPSPREAGEPASLLEMYGATPGDGSFASNCLLARRLAEIEAQNIAQRAELVARMRGIPGGAA